MRTTRQPIPEAEASDVKRPQTAHTSAWNQRRHSQDLPEVVVVDHELHNQPTPRSVSSASYSSALKTEEAQSSRHRLTRKRTITWCLIAAIVCLIVAGATVGAVIGTRLAAARLSSNNAGISPAIPPQPIMYAAPGFKPVQDTGLAVITSGTTRFVYQQITNGTIIEVRGDIQDNFQTSNATIVTMQAANGSPLAAASFNSQGKDYRAVSFFDAAGNVYITTTSGDGWTVPRNVIPSDAAVTTSPALALCADTDHIHGLRLFYPSKATNLIQMLSFKFNASHPDWKLTTTFRNSNVNSGIACTLVNGFSRVYYRHNNNVEQMTFDHTKRGSKWTLGYGSPGNAQIADSSDIAATSDDAGNDYIFYRRADNTITRGLINSTDTSFQAYQNFTKAPDGTKLTAAYFGSGSAGYTWLLTQPTGNTTLSWTSTSSKDASRTNGTLN